MRVLPDLMHDLVSLAQILILVFFFLYGVVVCLTLVAMLGHWVVNRIKPHKKVKNDKVFSS